MTLEHSHEPLNLPSRIQHELQMKSALCLVALLLFLVACSDAPDILITLQPPLTATPVELASWLPKPSAKVGEELFAEHCAACHGATGEGDGPLVVNQQIPAPRNFRLGEQRSLSPQAWFDVITYGKLDRFMPPWTSLSAVERWQLAWYSYTLFYREDELQRGEAIWQELCESCSDLDGPLKDTTGNTPFLSELNRDLDAMSRWSDEQLEEMISKEVADVIPTPALDEHDLQQLTQYLRLESLGGADYWMGYEHPPPYPWVSGDVVVSLPLVPQISNITVRIRASVDGETRDMWRADSIDADQARFNDLPLVDHWHYQALIELEDAEFRSLHYTSEQLRELQSIPVHRITAKYGALEQESLALQFYPLNSQELGELFQVTQALKLINRSEDLFSESEAIAWQIPLPSGARRVEIGAAARHRLDQDALAVYGFQPILAGAGEVVGVQYLVQRNVLAVYDYPLPYGLYGALRILIPAEGWQVLGLDLTDLGEEEINERIYRVYGAEVTYEPGHVIRFGIQAGD